MDVDADYKGSVEITKRGLGFSSDSFVIFGKWNGSGFEVDCSLNVTAALDRIHMSVVLGFLVSLLPYHIGAHPHNFRLRNKNVICILRYKQYS